MKTVFAFTGSFCNHAASLETLEKLVNDGNDIYPVFSPSVCSEDTRFGTADGLEREVTRLTGRTPLKTVTQVEETVTKGNFDCVLICPCTGNTAAKIANGITDTAVTMAAKCQLRSLRPVLLAIASNDALGANLKNIGTLSEKKNVFLVPMVQDDVKNKPMSLVCDFSLVGEALDAAVKGIQLRPMIISL